MMNPEQQLRMLSSNERDFKEKQAAFFAYGHLFNQNVGLTLSQTFTIGGKPSLTADGIWGRVLETKNIFFKWEEISNESVTLYAIRKDMSYKDKLCDIKYTLTLAEAREKGYAKGMGWAKFPMQMLMARCKTFVARALFSEVVAGMYAVEELSSNDLEQFQGLGEQPIKQPSTPPPFIPPVEPEQPPQQQPSALPSVSGVFPDQPKKVFSKLASQDPDSLLSMLVDNKVIDNTLASNNYNLLKALYKEMIRTEIARNKFGRLCLEGRECFLLACKLGVFAINLDDANSWKKLIKSHEQQAQSLADKFNYVDDPWTYYGKIFHDIGTEDIDIHVITQL